VNDSQKQAANLLEQLVIEVPDYPEPGILFRDITPVLANADALATVVRALAAGGRDHAGNVIVDKVVGMESRGFIVGAPVAMDLGVGFVPVRKLGKLPRATHAVTYQLEYGTATLEIHQDALVAGERVLVVDDVLATGGTASATIQLIESCGASVIAAAVMYELTFLAGREAIGLVPLTALAAV
jgi:adenine phosphoribosyltransferase